MQLALIIEKALSKVSSLEGVCRSCQGLTSKKPISKCTNYDCPTLFSMIRAGAMAALIKHYTDY